MVHDTHSQVDLYKPPALIKRQPRARSRLGRAYQGLARRAVPCEVVKPLLDTDCLIHILLLKPNTDHLSDLAHRAANLSLS